MGQNGTEGGVALRIVTWGKSILLCNQKMNKSSKLFYHSKWRKCYLYQIIRSIKIQEAFCGRLKIQTALLLSEKVALYS